MTDATPQPDPAVTSLTAKAGDKVDNYTIMEQVGAGGTAIVFRGHDHVLNRDVAIKQLVVPPGDAGDDLRQRALAEAEMHKRAAASDPKLLVQFIDTINDPRGLFLISEYVDGPSLEWILQQETRQMDQRQALGIIAATAKALDALHRTDMVHRDLKPSNILIPRTGGLKLADFGLAAIIAEQQSMDLGSVRYMAPEVLQGQAATPKSDLYSLGIIAYEMLAGRDNFNEAFRTILRDQRNQSMRWVKWHTNVRAKVTALDQLADGIPESLAQLVARMMEKDPARRVGSATELLEAIRNHFAQGGQEQTAPSPHAAMAPPKIEDVSQTAQIPRRSKLPIILAATLVVWVIAIGGFFFWKSQQEAQDQEQRTAALVTAIETADRLIADQKYEDARDAFALIPKEHASEFDPNNRRYRDDLVEAGQLKAQCLLAAENDDFIAALEKAQRYQKLMARWTPQPQGPKTNLNLIDAKKKVTQYSQRADFQEITDSIAAMLDSNQLSDAIEAIRIARNNSTTDTAKEDLDRLNALERRYNQKLGSERIVQLLDQAQVLREAGELRDAIELLDDERESAGADVSPLVTAKLEELNKLARIERIKQDITRAERSGDRGDLLASLKDLQREQASVSLDTRINELEIAMMIEEAEQARADGKPEKAQQILNDIIERDPDNPQVERMVAEIQASRSMVQALTLADQYLAQGNYAQAIAQYKLALTFGPDTNGQINKKILDATGRLHLEASELALAAGDLIDAQAQLDKAKAAHGETNAIDGLQLRIDNLNTFTELVKAGDELFAKASYGRAKAKYLEAKIIFERDAIVQKIRDCDFGIWIEQCERAILSRDWEAAEGALNRAEEIKKNDVTRALRDKIANRIQ